MPLAAVLRIYFDENFASFCAYSQTAGQLIVEVQL